ncbi:hypothetical protein Corgl_0391 [Coriobacterium glomerans PW2]|uniref:Uncharacterized protein n=1 Tax=Coriobacterium glomerans (strain ATCC 49209 / DSM 20642 / JCM 10262 / PW2) TaxID=700015 RepID=F2NAI2_CORGP|nr:hypothetical protein [Coriobacterium glomerans]AEB06509.1 hypothetical protein Corgl_0391 [Coriobacterium glomerans PW2]
MLDAKSGTVLFRSGPDEEYLVIECCDLEDGRIRIEQRSSGELTRWCFDGSPHTIEIMIKAKGVRRLCDYFDVSSSRQVVSQLAATYASCACIEKICSLLDWLSVGYVMSEQPPSR